MRLDGQRLGFDSLLGHLFSFYKHGLWSRRNGVIGCTERLNSDVLGDKRLRVRNGDGGEIMCNINACL
jgi:hypothetical protein